MRSLGLTQRLGAVVALQGAGQSVLVGLAPALVANAGIPVSVLGLLMALGTASLLAAAPLWGRWTDRQGPARSLRLGLLATLLAQLAFAVSVLGLAAQLVSAFGGLLVLALSRLLHGAAVAGVHPGCQAWVSASLGDGRLRGLAQLSAAGNLGRAAGPLLVLLLLPFGAWAPLLWLPLLPLLAWWALPRERAAGFDQAQISAAPEGGRNPLLLTLPLLLAAGLAQLQLLLGPVLVQRHGWEADAAAAGSAGVLLAATLSAALLQLRVLRDRAPARVLRGAALLLITGIAALLAGPPVQFLLVAIVLLSVGAALAMPACAALVGGAARRGRAFAQLGMAHTGGYTLGFACAGTLHALLPAQPWLGPLLVLAAAAVVAWMLSARVDGRNEAAVAAKAG